MGPQLARIVFAENVPSADELLAAAVRLGGLDIECIAAERNGAVLFFPDFPKGRVTIDGEGNRLRVSDFSLVAPVLFELLLMAGAELGGQMERDYPWSPLRLPLHRDDVRRATRMVHWLSAVVCVVLAGFVLAFLVALGVWLR